MAAIAPYSIRNPKLLLDGRIDMEVKYAVPHPLASHGWLPFTADPNDTFPGSIGPEAHALAMSKRGIAKQTEAELLPGLAAAARAKRDALLSACDWRVLPDTPTNSIGGWTAYRQQLRDVTKQPGFPLAIEWPAPPEG